MKKIWMTMLLIILFSGAWSQDTDEELNEDLFEAWTVEYIPYKYAVKDAIGKYMELGLENQVDIEVYDGSDQLVIIRSRTSKDKIYEIRYGNPYKGYYSIRLPNINYVFGQTLQKTLLDREKYLYFEFQLGGKKDDQLELDYIDNSKYWVNTDYSIDIPAKFTAKLMNFNGYYAVKAYWGDELLGLPYGSQGIMKLGIATKQFEIGFIAPSLMHFNYGSVTRADTTAENEENKLTSGLGGYGQFHLRNVNGYLAFSSLPFAITGVDTTDLYHMDYTMQLSFTKDIPIRNFIPLYKGTTMMSVGGYHLQVSNGYLTLDPDFVEHPGAKEVGNDYYYIQKEEPEKYSGFYLRIDGCSRIPDKRDFPRILWAYQFHSDLTSLFKITFNITRTFGISFTRTRSLYDEDSEIKWLNENATYVGLTLSFSS